MHLSRYEIINHTLLRFQAFICFNLAIKPSRKVLKSFQEKNIFCTLKNTCKWFEWIYNIFRKNISINLIVFCAAYLVHDIVKTYVCQKLFFIMYCIITYFDYNLLNWSMKIISHLRIYYAYIIKHCNLKLKWRDCLNSVTTRAEYNTLTKWLQSKFDSSIGEGSIV